MYFVIESEKLSDGTRRLVMYYRCPVCGYRVEVEQVVIKSGKDSIVVRRLLRS